MQVFSSLNLISSFNRSYLFFYKDNEVKVARQESVDDDKKQLKIVISFRQFKPKKL